MAEDTSLLAQAKALSKRPGPTCGIKPIIENHPQGVQVAELIEGCRSKEVQYTSAVMVLKRVGIELKTDTISRHVRGVCACVAS